jgi:hypothetical protein
MDLNQYDRAWCVTSVLGFLRLDGDFAPIKIGDKRTVSGSRKPICHVFYLIVNAPPFLNHDNSRGV